MCVLDERPREPTIADLETLAELARLAEALIEARSNALRAAEMAEEHRLTVERLERERRQFKQAERMASMGSYRYDIERKTTSWSDGIFDIHKLPVSGGVPIGQVMKQFPEPDREAFRAAEVRTLKTGEPFELEADFSTVNGDARKVRCSCEIEMVEGKPVALIGLMQDITERYRMEQRLRHQARIDDLTQLPNRAEFHRLLDDRLGEARAADADVAALLIDLDSFKIVNDRLGHSAGDTVLRQVAERLRAPYLDTCIPARLGGDEFAVLLPSTLGRSHAEPLLRKLLRSLHIVADDAGRIASVTGTIGLAWAGDASYDRDHLLRCADDALYQAKRSTKGTVQTYGPRQPREQASR